MAVFELRGMVRSRGKVIAIGDNGIFKTDSERIINKLDELGFRRISEPETSPADKEAVKESLPKRKKRKKIKK